MKEALGGAVEIRGVDHKIRFLEEGPFSLDEWTPLFVVGRSQNISVASPHVLTAMLSGRER